MSTQEQLFTLQPGQCREGRVESKGSKFLAYLFALDLSEKCPTPKAALQRHIEGLKKEHTKAVHFVSAVRFLDFANFSYEGHSVLSDKAGSLIVGGGYYRLGSSLASNLHNPTFSSQSLECQEGKPSAECKANSESKTITESTTLKNLNEALPNINNARDNASLAESNFAKSHTNSEFAHKEQHEILGFEMKNRGFGARSEEATLAVVPEAERVDSLMRDQRGQISEGKSTQKTSQGKAQGLGGSILDEKSGLCSRERGDKTRASID